MKVVNIESKSFLKPKDEALIKDWLKSEASYHERVMTEYHSNMEMINKCGSIPQYNREDMIANASYEIAAATLDAIDFGLSVILNKQGIITPSGGHKSIVKAVELIEDECATKDQNEYRYDDYYSSFLLRLKYELLKLV